MLFTIKNRMLRKRQPREVADKKYYEKHKEERKLQSRLLKGRRSEIYFESINKSFRTKVELGKFVKKLLLTLTDVIIERKHEYFQFLRELFKRHPDFNKYGEPVSFCFKTKDYPRDMKPYGLLFRSEKYRPFVLCVKGEWSNFSINKCISGLRNSIKTRVCEAFRWTINDQIKEFRKNCINVSCNICEKTDVIKPDIDHIIPFSKLMKDFLEENKLICENIQIYHKSGVEKGIKDQQLEKKWQEYHKKNAKLQKLCYDCHINKTISTTLVKPSS